MRPLARSAMQTTATAVIAAETERSLLQIGQAGVDLALWRRTLPEDLTNWLGTLPADDLPQGRVLVKSASLQTAISREFFGDGYVHCPASRLLAGDIVHLSRMFAQISGSDLVDVRLEAISGIGCWKFHRDCVTLRMLTTYRGPGTQWIDPEQGEQALAQQKTYSGPLVTMQAGEVGIFKGCRDNWGEGLVHRSPPFQDREEPRLFLALNLPTTASLKMML